MEHLPIKKRRFLFNTSSPPHNTSSSDVTQSVPTCLDSSSQEVKPKPDASCPPAASASLTVADLSGSIVNKVDGDKLVKASKKGSEVKDTFGISLGSYKSLQPPATIKLEPKSLNLPNISSKETGLHLHISPVPSKDVASSIMHCSTSDKATVDNPTTENQVTSQAQKSGVSDERLNWDLNTVMAWEDSPECDNHNIHTTRADGNKSCKEGNSKVCKQEQVSESASVNIANKSLFDMRSLTHTINAQMPQERKQNSNHINNKLLFPVVSSAPHVTVNNLKHLDSSINRVPSIVKSEYPPCDISTKHVKNANDKLGSPMTAGTGLSLDYTIPLGFNHSINTLPLKENVVSKGNVNHGITNLLPTTENENLNLSLVTMSSIEPEVQKSGATTFEEDDKAKVKKVITENLANKATPSLLNQNTVGSLLVIQSPVLPEVENQNQPSTVSSLHDGEAQVQVKAEKSTLTPSVSHTKDISQTPVDKGFVNENFPSDIQGSEVDNVDEVYDSQFEDGEMRELSVQTWEGSVGDERENEHENVANKGTCNSIENDSQCVPESSSRIRSTDVGSQKGTDEISSVLLPEKPDTSEQVSNSETRNDTREVSINMKDESESDQWKMNVSGSELMPDDNNHTVTSVKFYKRDPSTRDAFFNRGSRFRMKGYSSSNGDDSVSRSGVSRIVRSFRRGNSNNNNNTKFSPHVHTSNRGGATWKRSPGPTFRDVDDITNETCLDQNDDVRPGARQSFRTRLVGNREEDDFRARLGLRPAGDTCHTRFVGRGRSPRYNPRGGGARGRYGGPANDGYDEPLEYPNSNSFPRRRCFSPTERRENHPCVHHHSGSTSPPRSRTRSRSPRIRRPRSPNFRHGFEPDGFNNLEGRNNNSPPRWVKYNNKQRSAVFHRSPPPIGERLNFYDSSRKTKQNENYRSGRFSEVHGGVMDHGYRRGGFVKRHEIGRPVKHIEYDEEDGYGPVEGLEFHGHGRGNPKAYSNGTETRFREIPRRPREERENW